MSKKKYIDSLKNFSPRTGIMKRIINIYSDYMRKKDEELKTITHDGMYKEKVIIEPDDLDITQAYRVDAEMLNAMTRDDSHKDKVIIESDELDANQE